MLRDGKVSRGTAGQSAHIRGIKNNYYKTKIDFAEFNRVVWFRVSWRTWSRTTIMRSARGRLRRKTNWKKKPKRKNAAVRRREKTNAHASVFFTIIIIGFLRFFLFFFYFLSAKVPAWFVQNCYRERRKTRRINGRPQVVVASEVITIRFALNCAVYIMYIYVYIYIYIYVQCKRFAINILNRRSFIDIDWRRTSNVDRTHTFSSAKKMFVDTAILEQN